MTQDDFNNARDLIKEGLEVIAGGCYDMATGELELKTILMFQAMLQDVARATEALERDAPEDAEMYLNWLTEDGELVCNCPYCIDERASAAN